MSEWTIEADGKYRTRRGESMEDVADLVLDEFGKYGAAVSVGPGTLSITFTVDVPVEQIAYMVGTELLGDLLPKFVPTRIMVESTKATEERVGMSNVPDLVGVTEVAHELGVSKQRVSALRSSGQFPSPIADLAAGPVWLRSSVTRFHQNWARKSGRPRKPAPNVADLMAAVKDSVQASNDRGEASPERQPRRKSA